MREIRSRARAVGLCMTAMVWGAMAHAATVGAGSQYFQNWQMAQFVAPVATPVAGTPINAAVGGVPFTINTLGTAPRSYGTWGGTQNGALMYSTDLPANIGLPTALGNVWELGAGEISIKFQAPMLRGTTLFSHDFDGTDAAEYRFYNCSGTQVDATSVEFLQIATANNPAQTPPVAGSADSFWRLASVANVSQWHDLRAGGACGRRLRNQGQGVRLKHRGLPARHSAAAGYRCAKRHYHAEPDRGRQGQLYGGDHQQRPGRGSDRLLAHAARVAGGCAMDLHFNRHCRMPGAFGHGAHQRNGRHSAAGVFAGVHRNRHHHSAGHLVGAGPIDGPERQGDGHVLGTDGRCRQARAARAWACGAAGAGARNWRGGAGVDGLRGRRYCAGWPA